VQGLILLGLFLVVYLAARYFFALYYSQCYVKNSVSQSTSTVSTAVGSLPLSADRATTTPVFSSPSLYLGSFGYSPAAADPQKTTLYSDATVRAITFVPNYSWVTTGSGTASSTNGGSNSWRLNNFTGPYADRRCLGSNCLEQNGTNLYYNGQLLELPAAIKSTDLAAVSIGALSRRWLVGFTLKDGEQYSGQVFYFDGQKFSTLTDLAPISSTYFGLFGFGGEESDFLIIYGAHQGRAFRVRGNSVTDLSQFFGINVMRGGFKAETIKAASGSYVNWYVYSLSLNHPILLKLWQNRTADIVGETVFSNLFSGSEQSAVFKLISAGLSQVSLAADIRDNQGWEVSKAFNDYGFNNAAGGIFVTTAQSQDNTNPEILIKKISQTSLNVDAGSKASVQFLFSTDAINWQDVPLGENFDFRAGPLKFYYLKLTFPLQTDKFYSPFVSSVLFDYLCQKL
jgi:hypothetical protein